MRLHKFLSPLLLASGMVAISNGSLLAQTGERHNTTENISGEWASAFDNVIIGPNADITINGNWYITATTVTIDPAARIGGTGTMHIMTPKTYGKAAALTTLNPGGALTSTTGVANSGITCKVSLENGAGVVLVGQNLVMGNNLAFAKVGSHLTLNGNNVVFTASAAAIPTITNAPGIGFTGQDANNTTFQDAYIVTGTVASGAGGVGKAGIANNISFNFPIGYTRNSGASTDYTPANVKNTAGVTRNIGASVTDYANSTPIESALAKGINRTWKIQTFAGSGAGSADVALTHNANTEVNGYDRSNAFVTQYTTAGGWSIGMPMPFTAPDFTNTGSFNIPVAGDDNGSFFSKSSDAINSLNPFIAVSAKVFLQGAYSGSNMTNSLRMPTNMIPAAQPYNFAPFNYAGTETAATTAASTTDWVLVELRDATTPSTVVATRAGLIMNNGNIMDIDGVTPLSFRNTAPGNYFVAVRHRNHLAVRSATAQTFTQDGNTAYDFTTAQASAYQDPSFTANNAAQASVTGGNFAMWGGNANSNAIVNYGPFGSDRFYMLTTPRNSGSVLSGLGNNQSTGFINYSNSDVNMNGVVNYGPFGSDRFFLLVNVLGNNSTKIINQHL